LLFLSIIIIGFPDSESTSTYLAIQAYEFTHSLWYSTVFDEESGRSIYLQAHFKMASGRNDLPNNSSHNRQELIKKTY